MAKQGDSNEGSMRRCCEGFCGFLFTAGLIVLIYWAIFQPHHIRATVESATLSNLTVSTSNASSVAEVSYNLVSSPSTSTSTTPASTSTFTTTLRRHPWPGRQRHLLGRVLLVQKDQRRREAGVRLWEAGHRRRRRRRRWGAAEGDEQQGTGAPGAGRGHARQVRVQDLQAAAEAEDMLLAEHSGEGGRPGARRRWRCWLRRLVQDQV